MRARHLAVAACLGAASLMHGQPAEARPEFEVASVKLNTSGCAGGRGGPGSPPPGRLSVTCITVRDLIQAAYGAFANGPNRSPGVIQVLNAPGWVDSDAFDIAAKPAGNATIDQMYGPMLQALLEDRFRLKIHRETRELPVYTLTVAKGGPALQAAKEGSCTLLDLNHPPRQPAPAFCGRASIKRDRMKMTVDAYGVSMAAFAGTTLSARLNLDRPVADKTGLTGLFDVHLEFAADNTLSGPDLHTGPAPSPDSGPSIFTALQEQLGLKLSPGKGPVEVLVVDHIEKPSGN